MTQGRRFDRREIKLWRVVKRDVRYKSASCKTRGRVVKQRRDNDRREIKL